MISSPCSLQKNHGVARNDENEDAYIFNVVLMYCCIETVISLFIGLFLMSSVQAHQSTSLCLCLKAMPDNEVGFATKSVLSLT